MVTPAMYMLSFNLLLQAIQVQQTFDLILCNSVNLHWIPTKIYTKMHF